MSEEKKITELNDKELEKVNGGFGKEMVECQIFNAGDCFTNGTSKIKVKHDYLIPVDKPQEVEVTFINYYGDISETSFDSNYPLFQECYFMGNNAW